MEITGCTLLELHWHLAYIQSMQPGEEAGVDPLDWYRDHVDEAYGDDIEADRDNVTVMMILVTNEQLCDQSLGIWSSTSLNQHPLLWSLLYTEQSRCILHTWKCTLHNTQWKSAPLCTIPGILHSAQHTILPLCVSNMLHKHTGQAYSEEWTL